VRTAGEALDFLSLSGQFRLQDEEYPKKHETLSWSDFQRWQELVRILMQKGSLSEQAKVVDGMYSGAQNAAPESLKPILGELSLREIMWLRGNPDGILIRPVPESTKAGSRNILKARILAHSSLEAILAAVYVDGLSGVLYGKCEYCGDLYEIDSSHSRQYCDQTCAQKAGVRRRRAAAKAASAKTKARKARGITRKESR
jgi:hypothetical protein